MGALVSTFLGVGVGVVLGCALGELLRSTIRVRARCGRVLTDFIKNFYYPRFIGVAVPPSPLQDSVGTKVSVADIKELTRISTTLLSISNKSTTDPIEKVENVGRKLKSGVQAGRVTGGVLKPIVNTNDSKVVDTTKVADDSNVDVKDFVAVSVLRVSMKQLPDMTRSCIEANFTCYRSIIPWITMVNKHMGFIVSDVLPEKGPVPSIELGSMLAQLICEFRVTDMKLPILVNTIVNGQVYLHFDAMKLEAVNLSISKLLAFNGFVGASLDPTAMIKAAASVGAPTIAANEASGIFREQLNSMVKVETVLSNEDQDLINRERCFVRYLQKNNITNDHPLMAAYREIIRIDFDNMFNVSKTKLRTLVLGASSREVRLYNHNKNVFFQIALCEGKDMNRMVTNCLIELKEMKSKKLTRKKATGKEEVLQRAEKAVVDVKVMINEWRSFRKIPERFMLWDESFEVFRGRHGLNNFDVVVFQDVGYNFSEKDWLNIFYSTGATTGYGYMCLPWELLEPKLLSTHGYVYKVEGNKSKLAYYGYANGYVHETSNWSTLMKKPVLVDKTFSIIIEFVARIGPMTCIRMVKSNIKELHVRNLQVPDYLRTVQILDIVESFNSRKQQLDLNKLVYFPVKASEFHDVVNYALDVAKESINFNTILLYIRRRCSGISLVTRDIAKTWTAPKQKLPAFALVVYLYTNHMISDFVNLQEKHHMVMPSRFKLFIRKLFMDSDLMEMFRSYYEYFLQQDLFHVLVKDVDHSFWQERWATGSKHAIKVFSDPNPEDYLDVSDDETQVDDFCSMCVTLKEVCGEQLFTCDRSVAENHQHEFTLNNDELTKLKTLLGDTAKDHVAIKHVKEVALSKVPPSTFTHKAIVHYVCGPPGTGKSYIIRALAKRDDLVITPFARLKQDYTNFVHPVTKQKCSLRCHTQHAAFTALNHPRVFVDEYTAMAYEFLSVIVYNCAAEEVFLVGDHRQVSLINEVEGLSITTKLDLTKLRSHELVRNYRNPKDAVYTLNTVYLYNMVNMKDFDGFKFDDIKNYSNYEAYTPLFFRYSTAERFGVDVDTCQKVTVRSNQGATYNKVKLIVTDNDKDIFNIPSMAIVALSRHTDECVILYEHTSICNIFVQNIISGFERPRVASLPKLSPIFGKLIQLDLPVQEKIVSDKVDNNDKVEEVVLIAPNKVEDEIAIVQVPFTLKKRYRLKPNIVISTYNSIVSSDFILLLVPRLKLFCHYVYVVLLYIRDFNHWTLLELLQNLFTYFKTKLFNLLFEEYVEGGNNAQYLSETKLEEVVGTPVVEMKDTKEITQISEVNLVSRTDDVKGKETAVDVLIKDEVFEQHLIAKHQAVVAQEEGSVSVSENADTEVDSQVDVVDDNSIETVQDNINEVNEQVEPQEPLQEDAQETLPISSNVTKIEIGVQTEFVDDAEIIIEETKEAADLVALIDTNSSENEYISEQAPCIEHEILEETQVEQLVNIIEPSNNQENIVLTSELVTTKTFDINKLPESNICMLQALGTITGNKVDDVWKSMLIAVGPEKASELYNQTWSTDEMQLFCCLNNITVTVLVDDREDIGCVYGSGQNHIGTIDFLSAGIGHFYVKNPNIYRGFFINLITDKNDQNMPKRRLDRFYITSDTLKQLATFGDTPYNLYVYDIILNYMRDGSLSDMIGGETDLLNDIGLCDAILVKNKLPSKFDFLKVKSAERKTLNIIATGFSKPLLVIDLSNFTMTFVITKEYDHTTKKGLYKPLSKFLETENVSLNSFVRFVSGRIVPNNIKHLPAPEIKIRLERILMKLVKNLEVNKTMSGGTLPQLKPFNNLPAVKAKEISYIPLASVDSKFKDMARLFIEPIELNAILVENKLDDENEFVPIENTSFDAFRMLFEDMVTIDEFNFELSNQEALGYLDNSFGGGTFNLTAFDNINQKFKPQKQTENAWSLLNVAPGVTYFKSHLTQSLYCLQMRYLTKAFVCAQSVQSIDKAREIAELFFYEHMKLNFDIFNEQDLYQTVLESEKAMEEKNYDKQADFELSADTIVRFSMKDIFKPFKSSIDLFKPGQGISAWSKNLQTIFQTSFRIINKHFINCLAPNVIFDNGIDEFNLMIKVNNLLKLLPDVAINGVIDATACDSGQNKFTQMIERVILEKLGINDDFLDWYYTHREEYVLKGYNVTAVVTDIKTSGEPATLLNNTILMACLMNYLIRGDGPSVLVIKGDDGLKRQLNLRCNEEVLPILRNYLKMDFKIDINVPITFCGYFLSGSNLVPDIVRKCFKIAGHRFKDYKHFAEYQQSLRDWVLTVNKLDVSYVCDITASSYKLDYEFVSNLFESIVSLTHINERQFRNTYKLRTFNWVEDYEHSTPWKDKLPWYKGYV